MTGATSAVGLALGSVNGAFNLDVALSALETSGNGRILSTPRVTTQNNVAAEMKQGIQIPIQTVSNNTVTVTFKDAALVLQVTPQITSANTVIMLVSLENASPDFSRAVNGIPPINTQRARTQVLVSDGQTTVIGGIYVSTAAVGHRPHAGPRVASDPQMALQAGLGERAEHRTADLHHAEDYQVMTPKGRTPMRHRTRLAALAALVLTTISCGDVVRQGRAPVYLVINSLAGASGGVGGATTFSGTLFSDVQTLVTSPAPCSPTAPCATVFADSGQAIDLDGPEGQPPSRRRRTIRSPSRGTTCEYTRADGRNTPGVDVPYSFDGAVTATVSAGATATITLRNRAARRQGTRRRSCS